MLVPNALGAHLAVFALGVHVARVDLVRLEDVAAVDVQRVSVEVVALELFLGLGRCHEHGVLLREFRVVLLNLPAAVVLEVEQRHGILNQVGQVRLRDAAQVRLAFAANLVVADELVEPCLGAHPAHVGVVVEQTHLGILRLHEFGLVQVGVVLAPHYDVLLLLDELDVGLAHFGVPLGREDLRHDGCLAEDAQLVTQLQLLLAFLLQQVVLLRVGNVIFIRDVEDGVFGLLRVVAAHPGVLLARGHTLAAQPRVQRLVDPPVDFIGARLELVGVEFLDHALLPPGPDGLFARAHLDFDVCAQVFLLFDVRVVVSAFPED